MLGILIGVFSYLAQCVNEVVIILAILMIFDYVTGTTVALTEKNFSAKAGAWGAVKKLYYIMILATGYLSDILINSFAIKLGLSFCTHGALGFAVAFYLIGNEGISLYMNWSKLGLPAPKFLFNIFSNIKLLAKNTVKKNQLTSEDKEEEDDHGPNNKSDNS